MPAPVECCNECSRFLQLGRTMHRLFVQRTISMTSTLRNIAIIAHVDHGKTTLVDKLLRESDTLEARTDYGERIMDSNSLEKERGITPSFPRTRRSTGGIRAAIPEYRINIVDTPGPRRFWR